MLKVCGDCDEVWSTKSLSPADLPLTRLDKFEETRFYLAICGKTESLTVGTFKFPGLGAMLGVQSCFLGELTEKC